MDPRRSQAYARIVPGRTSCCLLLPQSGSRKSPGNRMPGLLFYRHIRADLSVGRLVNLAQQPPVLPPRAQQQADCEHRRCNDQRFHGAPSGPAAHDTKRWALPSAWRASIRSIRYPLSTVSCRIGGARGVLATQAQCDRRRRHPLRDASSADVLPAVLSNLSCQATAFLKLSAALSQFTTFHQASM